MLSSVLWAPSADAGEIEPPADAVDGSGNPVGTMKSMVHVQPTWSRAISGAQRFVLVMESGQAVLDRETGLVWEKSLATTSDNQLPWADSFDACNLRGTGGRYGWRMPTLVELLTLLDTGEDDRLPANHPFVDLPTAGGFTWTATTEIKAPDKAKVLYLFNEAASIFNVQYKYFNGFVWCVRGGGGGQPSVAIQPIPTAPNP
jgi:hypothetical protein